MSRVSVQSQRVIFESRCQTCIGFANWKSGRASRLVVIYKRLWTFKHRARSDDVDTELRYAVNDSAYGSVVDDNYVWVGDEKHPVIEVQFEVHMISECLLVLFSDKSILGWFLCCQVTIGLWGYITVSMAVYGG